MENEQTKMENTMAKIKQQIILLLVKIYLGFLIKYELTFIVVYNFYMGFSSCSLHISFFFCHITFPRRSFRRISTEFFIFFS